MGTGLANAQAALKKKVLEKFFAIMFLRQSDQKSYGGLLKELGKVLQTVFCEFCNHTE